MSTKDRAAALGRGAQAWWLTNRWVDPVAATMATGIYGLLVWQTGRFDVLGWLAPADRRGLYTAAALVVSLIGALSGVAVGQVGSAKGARMLALKKGAGPALAASWKSIYRGAFLAAVLALVALSLDASAPQASGHNAVVAQWVFLFGLSLAVTKFFRLSELFYATILGSAQDDVDSTDAAIEPAVAMDPQWLRERRDRISA